MTISFARHQFPPDIIRHAVWLYVRFTLSYRDVEDLLAERGLDVSYETVRRWVLKFGPLFARELRRQRPRPTSTWHLDEMAVVIAGRQFWLWRAVDDEGEVLDLLVQRRRDKAAAVKLMRKLLKKQGFAPDVLVTDRLRSYGAAKVRNRLVGSPRAGACAVESTTGAVAVGPEEWLFAGSFRTLPVPQFGPWLRFQSPLVKPDVRISRIRLSPVPSNLRSWQVAAVSRDGVEAERLIKILVRDLVEPGAFASRSP